MGMKFSDYWPVAVAVAVYCIQAQAEVKNVKTCQDGSHRIPCAKIGTSLPYESGLDFVEHIKVDGQIRSYYFSRLYGPGSSVPDQNAYSLGGLLNVHTPSVYGLSAAFSFYTANSLGTRSTTNPAVVDTSLAGLQASINTFGQAYLQYQYQDFFKFRVGNQVIDTPWLSPSDSRALPATYQGVYGELTPTEYLHLYGMRIFRWKSRTSADYYSDNLYYQVHYDGDPLYSGQARLSGSAPPFPGTLAFGATAEGLGGDAQIWYYNFYRFARMIHADANYTLETGFGIDPFINGQFIHEWGSSLLSNAKTGAGRVNSTAFGIRTGINYDFSTEYIGKGTLSLAYNKIEDHRGAVLDGAIVSPYTAGYITDPLYTTSMIRGLVDMAAAGNGYKVGWTQHFWDKRFRLTLAYASYNLQGNVGGSADDEYVDLAYSPQGLLKGFSIRDRMEIAHGAALGRGRRQYFLYNRLMVTYAF